MGKTFAGPPDLGAFVFLGSPLFPPIHKTQNAGGETQNIEDIKLIKKLGILPPKLGFPALLGGAELYWFAGGPAGSSSAPPQQNMFFRCCAFVLFLCFGSVFVNSCVYLLITSENVLLITNIFPMFMNLNSFITHHIEEAGRD